VTLLASSQETLDAQHLHGNRSQQQQQQQQQQTSVYCHAHRWREQAHQPVTILEGCQAALDAKNL
jgi:hypothetical protein